MAPAILDQAPGSQFTLPTFSPPSHPGRYRLKSWKDGLHPSARFDPHVQQREDRVPYLATQRRYLERQ
jgi:hypothetical protein